MQAYSSEPHRLACGSSQTGGNILENSNNCGTIFGVLIIESNVSLVACYSTSSAANGMAIGAYNVDYLEACHSLSTSSTEEDITSAMESMNAALAGSGYHYILNTDEATKADLPLVIVKTN